MSGDLGLEEGVRPADLAAMSWVGHLGELRTRLIVGIAALVLGVTAGWFAVPRVLALFARTAAQGGGRLVFIAPGEAFFSQLRIAAAVGVVLASPVLIWEGWRFVVPALFPHERRLGRTFLPAAAFLAIAGLAFGYGVVFPVSARALMMFSGAGLEPVLSVGRILSYLMATTLPFAVIFQLPPALVLLGALGMADGALLRRVRRAGYLLAFVLAGMLSPNVPAQCLMAVPLIVLYEVSVPLVDRVAKRREARGAGGDRR